MVAMAPSSQVMEPPSIPGRFSRPVVGDDNDGRDLSSLFVGTVFDEGEAKHLLGGIDCSAKGRESVTGSLAPRDVTGENYLGVTIDVSPSPRQMPSGAFLAALSPQLCRSASARAFGEPSRA
ncbi:MAG: hypothetical protein DCC49_07115 [Acidobacteria bacterium]|nr:MAG: hypothetical protein DCC49_07115 [Acidobacteriota bacterium]